MVNSISIGASVEDSYFSAGLVNLESRELIDNSLRRKRINPKGSPEEIISGWAGVLQEIMQIHPMRTIRIGMGIPGNCEYKSGIFLGKDKERYGSLYGQNIKELLAKKLNINEGDISLLNDAASFFQGEIFAGAVRGHKKSFGITLGMGLGSARYNNQLVEDAHFWKFPFKNSIAEDYLSSRWLVNRFKEISGIEVADLVEMKRFSPDRRVEQVFDEFADNLGDFLVEVINSENPDVLLIGGHMESSNRFFFKKAVDKVTAKKIKTPVMKAILGEKANIIGAASSWYENTLHS